MFVLSINLRLTHGTSFPLTEAPNRPDGPGSESKVGESCSASRCYSGLRASGVKPISLASKGSAEPPPIPVIPLPVFVCVLAAVDGSLLRHGAAFIQSGEGCRLLGPGGSRAPLPEQKDG